MFNPTLIPASYKSGNQAPIDSKFYFTNEADLQNIANNRPLEWFKNMPGINMETGVEYRWKESAEGLIVGGYTYPAGVVSFGIDYSGLTYNWVAFDLNVNFDASPLDDNVTVPESVGGILAGVTVATLQTKSLNQIIKEILLPAKDAYIAVNEEASATCVFEGQTREVGQALALTINYALNQGQIFNGNGSLAGNVIGELDSVTILGPNDAIIYTDSNPLTNNVSAECNPFIHSLGVNTVKVVSQNFAGNSTYSNSHLTAQTVSAIEARKIVTNRPTINLLFYGAYKFFYIVGNDNSFPTTSSGVRALTSSFLNTDNTGEFTIAIPSGENGKECSFFIPQGKTIQVLDLGNLNLDVTRDFKLSTITVNDAAGNPVSYVKYTRNVGGSGYINATSLKVIIT